MTFSVMNSAKAILVFRALENDALAEGEPAVEEQGHAENTAQEETAEAVGEAE